MARRSLLAVLGVATFVVPSGFQPATAGSADASYERTDDVEVFDGYTCEIQSRQVRHSDGTVEMQTRASDPLGDPNTCYFGATEVRVRYTYTDADGDTRSGEAAAPSLVNVTVQAGGASGFRSFHSATFSDGTQTAEFPLPK